MNWRNPIFVHPYLLLETSPIWVKMNLVQIAVLESLNDIQSGAQTALCRVHSFSFFFFKKNFVQHQETTSNIHFPSFS